MTLSRFFLLLLVSSLVVSALLAAGIVLFGHWGETEVRVLLSTGSIAAYSLLKLCCSSIYSPREQLGVSRIGLLFCGLGLSFALMTNWEIIKPEAEILFKSRFSLLSISMAFAVSSLMLRISAKSTMVRVCRNVTIALIVLNTINVNQIIFGAFTDTPESLWKLIWVFSIFGVLGVVVTPILNKFSSQS